MDWFGSSKSTGTGRKPDLFGFNPSGSTASMEEAGKKINESDDEDLGTAALRLSLSNAPVISKNQVYVRKKDWKPEDDGIDTSIEGVFADPLKRVKSRARRLPVFEELSSGKGT